MKVAGATFIVAAGNPRPLNDTPGILSYVDVVILIQVHLSLSFVILTDGK